ncbi:MAG TPA: hypothetical protein EYP23_00090 [Thermoplasmata archaeon]|nr:hypothetical protein [Thermoplasmata archaeon]
MARWHGNRDYLPIGQLSVSPHVAGSGLMNAYLSDELLKKGGIIGFYKIEVDFYIKGDGSSKTVVYPRIHVVTIHMAVPIPIQKS